MVNKKLFTKNLGILFLYFLLFSLVAYVIYLFTVEYFISPGCPSNPNPNFKTCPNPPVKGSGQPDPTCVAGKYSNVTGGPCTKLVDPPSPDKSSDTCRSNKGCSSCASVGGCVWCNDLKECVKSDRQGFPVRTQLSKPNACKGNSIIEFNSDCPSNSGKDIRKKGYNTVNPVTGYDPNPSQYPVYHKKGGSSNYGRSEFPIYFSTEDDDDLTNDYDYKPPPPPRRKKE